MTCGECGNVTAPGAGFPNHVYCKRFLLHMEKREDASRCRDFIPKPITNADRIRSMTDEELAELFMQEYDCSDSFTCPVQHPCPPEKEASCRECFLDWLKEEASE